MLAARIEEFRTRWAAHNVRLHRSGTKRLCYPIVGAIDLDYEALEVAADEGLVIHVYTAEPGSASQQALDILASWISLRQRPMPSMTPRPHNATEVT